MSAFDNDDYKVEDEDEYMRNVYGRTCGLALLTDDDFKSMNKEVAVRELIRLLKKRTNGMIDLDVEKNTEEEICKKASDYYRENPEMYKKDIMGSLPEDIRKLIVHAVGEDLEFTEEDLYEDSTTGQIVPPKRYVENIDAKRLIMSNVSLVSKDFRRYSLNIGNKMSQLEKDPARIFSVLAASSLYEFPYAGFTVCIQGENNSKFFTDLHVRRRYAFPPDVEYNITRDLTKEPEYVFAEVIPSFYFKQFLLTSNNTSKLAKSVFSPSNNNNNNNNNNNTVSWSVQEFEELMKIPHLPTKMEEDTEVDEFGTPGKLLRSDPQALMRIGYRTTNPDQGENSLWKAAFYLYDQNVNVSNKHLFDRMDPDGKEQNILHILEDLENKKRDKLEESRIVPIHVLYELIMVLVKEYNRKGNEAVALILHPTLGQMDVEFSTFSDKKNETSDKVVHHEDLSFKIILSGATLRQDSVGDDSNIKVISSRLVEIFEYIEEENSKSSSIGFYNSPGTLLVRSAMATNDTRNFGDNPKNKNNWADTIVVSNDVGNQRNVVHMHHGKTSYGTDVESTIYIISMADSPVITIDDNIVPVITRGSWSQKGEPDKSRKRAILDLVYRAAAVIKNPKKYSLKRTNPKTNLI